MNTSNILLQIDNTIEFRFIYPIAPFGVIGAIVIIPIFIFFESLDSVDFNIIRFLAFLLGLIISEIFYFYYNEKLFLYEQKLEVLKGGKVKQSYMYDNIKRIEHSKNFILGAGNSTRSFYLEVVFFDGTRDRIIFGGFIFQSGKVKKSLNVLKECGVEVVNIDN